MATSAPSAARARDDAEWALPKNVMSVSCQSNAACSRYRWPADPARRREDRSACVREVHHMVTYLRRAAQRGVAALNVLSAALDAYPRTAGTDVVFAETRQDMVRAIERASNAGLATSDPVAAAGAGDPTPRPAAASTALGLGRPARIGIRALDELRARELAAPQVLVGSLESAHEHIGERVEIEVRMIV